MDSYLVLRVVAKLLMPFILIYGLYVQFHGDFGPGGGFQAGVIFAAGFILYSLIFGIENGRKVMPPWLRRALLSIGVIIFGGTGLFGLILGGNFLDYNVFLENPVAGQHLGILLVELGVGITVSATMITIFFVFASQDQ